MRYLVFSEPHQTGIVEIKRTEAEAITYQRDYALRVHNFHYENDEQALHDYMCVNWAFWREEL